MNKYIKILLSIPKTVWFNLTSLPLKVGCRLPVFVSYDTHVSVRGRIVLENPKTADVRIGFHNVDVCDNQKTKLILKKGSTLVLKGDAHIGHGSRIVVHENATMQLGKNFAISANSELQAYGRITFGDDIQFSWDCLVMDSDTHSVLSEDGAVINPDKPVVFGDRIWIGCRSAVLKGSVIPDNCVIGAGSLVCGGTFTPGTIIAGSPARSVKPIGGWKL